MRLCQRQDAKKDCTCNFLSWRATKHKKANKWRYAKDVRNGSAKWSKTEETTTEQKRRGNAWPKLTCENDGSMGGATQQLDLLYTKKHVNIYEALHSTEVPLMADAATRLYSAKSAMPLSMVFHFNLLPSCAYTHTYIHICTHVCLCAWKYT